MRALRILAPAQLMDVRSAAGNAWLRIAAFNVALFTTTLFGLLNFGGRPARFSPGATRPKPDRRTSGPPPVTYETSRI